jgi:hypothetical protein
MGVLLQGRPAGRTGIALAKLSQEGAAACVGNVADLVPFQLLAWLLEDASTSSVSDLCKDVMWVSELKRKPSTFVSRVMVGCGDFCGSATVEVETLGHTSDLLITWPPDVFLSSRLQIRFA